MCDGNRLPNGRFRIFLAGWSSPGRDRTCSASVRSRADAPQRRPERGSGVTMCAQTISGRRQPRRADDVRREATYTDIDTAKIKAATSLLASSSLAYIERVPSRTNDMVSPTRIGRQAWRPISTWARWDAARTQTISIGFMMPSRGQLNPTTTWAWLRLVVEASLRFEPLARNRVMFRQDVRGEI